MDTVDNVITKPVHRLEVFTGAGRRRMFTSEDKARIVAEIAASGDSVSGVARRHGLSPQQLFGWRRQLRACPVGRSKTDRLEFVPAVFDATSPESAVPRQRRAPSCKAEPGAGTIEVEIHGVTVRVGRGVDAKTIRAVLGALKASA